MCRDCNVFCCGIAESNSRKAEITCFCVKIAKIAQKPVKIDKLCVLPNDIINLYVYCRAARSFTIQQGIVLQIEIDSGGTDI